MTTQIFRFSTFRPWLLIFALYLALAILVTWPAVTDFSGAFIGHHTGDSYEMGHHLWWYGYALKHGQPLFTQTLLGYPDGIGGISLWSNPLQFFPASAFALVMPVAAAYNLQVLLTMGLNGLTMAYLVTRLGARAGRADAGRITYPPAVIAGAAFLTFPVFQGHLFGGHGGLMVMWPVPLYLDALFSLREGFTRGRFIRTVIWFVFSPFGHTLQLIYVLMPVTGLFVLSQLMTRDIRGTIRTSAAALTGAFLLIAIFALPVAADAFDETYTGDLGTIIFSADLLGVVTPSFESPIWGGVGYSRAVLGTNLIEGLTYYGLVAAVLSLIAVWKRREARWWLLLGVIAAVLALGPLINIMGRPATLKIDNAETFITTPWAWIYNLPGFSLARSPGRFSFTLALAAAVLVGMGAAVLWRGRGRFLAIALAALLVVDYQSFTPFPVSDAAIPAAIMNLRDRDDVRAVMDMPWGNLLAAKHGLYLQTGHEKPLIAGQVTRRTPVSAAKLTILEESLDPALMHEAGVDAIILHKRHDDGSIDANLRAAYGTPEFEDGNFALYFVPDYAAPPLFTVTGEADSVRVTARHELHFYAPVGGLFVLNGEFSGSGTAADFSVMLNGETLQHTQANGQSALRVPLFVEAGYHTAAIALDRPCPTLVPSSALRCSAATVSGLTLRQHIVGPVTQVGLDGGVTLEYAAAEYADGEVAVYLDWGFAATRQESDVRFIKLMSGDGEDLGGFDSAPGAIAAGERLAETIAIRAPDGFSGALDVYTGWYSYPEIARFPVHGEGLRAQDGLIYIGTVDIP